MIRRNAIGTGLRALTALAFAGVVSSCATQTVRNSGSGVVAGTSPLQSVERFLAAVNARDLDNMSELFGTPDGPVDWPRVQTEVHMDLLATILEHQSYEIVSEGMVPGRDVPTTRVGVTLTMEDRVIPDVSFLTVRTDEGRWMVQEIDLERVTGRE
jgi:hypothetical protein